MTEPLKISVCLIVKNEADRLEKTLAPFIGKVSEIIAYDSGSTDDTLEILKKLGVTVISGSWLGFSATRKALWSMAKEDWILWLDADEIFSMETIEALEKIFKEKNLPSGFRVRRRVVFENKIIRHGDWGNDWVLRIFRRDNYQMADRIVHESVTVKGEVVDLPGIVEHHSFRSWADLEARSQRYAELWAQQKFEEIQKKKNKTGVGAGGPTKKSPSVEGVRGWAASPFLHSVWKFFRGYFIKSGWLDGPLGLKIALHNAREVFQKYKLLQHLHRQHPMARV